MPGRQKIKAMVHFPWVFLALVAIVQASSAGSTLQATLDAFGEVQANAASVARMMRAERSDEPARTRILPAVTALEMETMSNASFHLDQKLQSVAQELRAGTPTRDFLMKLSVCVPCNHFNRFGHHDEGYVMCTDDLDDQSLAGAYSYGVHGSDTWGMDIASRYHVPLHEYAKDCLEPQKPEPCEGCTVHFHGDCVVGARAPMVNPKYKTLAQNIHDNGDTKDGSLLLKLDANGDEWEVFAEQPSATLQKFRQVAVKFQQVTHQEKHNLYLRAVKNLEESGFAVAYLSGKKFGKLTHFERDLKQYHVPDELEVLYMQLPSQGCSRDLKFRVPDDLPDSIPEQLNLEEALPTKI